MILATQVQTVNESSAKVNCDEFLKVHVWQDTVLWRQSTLHSLYVGIQTPHSKYGIICNRAYKFTAFHSYVPKYGIAV